VSAPVCSLTFLAALVTIIALPFITVTMSVSFLFTMMPVSSFLPPPFLLLAF
jgi:hypothetical protein